jgi:hypothetical protein
MSHATVQRGVRGLGSLSGGLILAGLVVFLTSPGLAQPPSKTTPEKGKAPDKAVPEKTLVYPTFPKLTVSSRSSEVADQVKVINDLLEASWKANKIIPAGYVEDHEFIRRASLDIIGRIARPDEIERYLKDPAATRRSLLIDRLLDSEEYPLHWSSTWTNWLLSRTGVFGHGTYHEGLNDWLKDQFAQSVTHDKLVTALLTASGDNTKNGAVNFILAHVGEAVPGPRVAEEGQFEMVPITSRITRLFLGTQVQCAQCHDHPFQNSLKQNHFWGVNAFLRQVQRVGQPPAERMRGMAYPKLELKDNEAANPQAAIFYEKRNGVVLLANAEFLPSGDKKRGERLKAGLTGVARRTALAEYVIDHDNFSRAYVNRMWGVFFGKGFVNPIDDFNDQNLPSNPDLLNSLAGAFKNYGYDQKKFIRWICNSHAYNLSCVANKTNDKPDQEVFFSRMLLKSMSPEQLFESLATATRAEVGTKPEERKTLRDRWMNNLVANFGDDEGNEVSFNGTIVQALLMMNGEDINNAIKAKGGTVDQAMAKAGRGSDYLIIRELFLATLNREPRKTELDKIHVGFNLRVAEKELNARYQDLFWALLNSSEFLLNH